ncbi:PREDICTED: alpha-humulene/(-)-(E)-beta-caryophyllene synthase-like [Tarenaya hassleriana]|uniref:alpha-humulene/(-)-(E)-beta-caryophyllene synthase-like n=1 Tax=Tarenaya hassleriana TaxID=28532 RepID=UPI00053C65C9|nr:PREDICTED: alpha-humulene/(-)-(E)-beta-caryophyllene synthase-like [Tarenaya hassleriana]
MEKFTNPATLESADVLRPLADFPVNIWEDPLASFAISETESHTYDERLKALKEEVKESFVASKANMIENIKLIDALSRLGISYHFEQDIQEQLEKVFLSDHLNEMTRTGKFDLSTAGVLFQVFRQFGYKVSTQVFDKFKNEDGKFDERLGEDARGMLSLYEASQWSTRGEDILDEALSFSTTRLETLSRQCAPHLAVRIENALKHSFHKGITRLETRRYITYYEEEPSHDKVLLEFAKVDFNSVQLLHRQEIGHVYRWYKELQLDVKLPYARDRVIESYLWALGAYFEPQYSRGRIIVAITIILLTLLDDTYDAYGTPGELDQFTDALERWDRTAAEGLPDSMKYLHHVILDFYDKIEEEMDKETRLGCGFHAKKSFILTAKGYHKEAKWLREDYVATFKEYKENGIFLCAYYAAITSSFVGTGDVAKLDAFEWLSSYPKVFVASLIISRFMDDISTYEFEHKRKHVGTAIDCYMKEYGVAKGKAIEEIQNIIMDSWKELNQELMRPHLFPFPLLMRILNLTRVIDVFYKYQDLFTNPELLRDDVVSLFIEEIPI